MKKVSLLLFAALASFSMSAQKSSANGNWFVGAGASATMYLGAHDQHADILDRMTVNPQIMVGKWFNPYLGARLAAQAGKVHSFNGSEAEKMYSMTHLNAHVDMMFNVTNLLAGYKENRFYNFIPTVGMGYERRDQDGAFFKHRGFNGATLNASLLNTFRLSNRLSAYIEVGGYIVESRFDKGYGDAENGSPLTNKTSHWNGIMNGTAGLVLNIGKQGFGAAPEVCDNSDLLAQIDKLRAENDDLRRRKPEVKEVIVTKEVKVEVPCKEANLNNVVFFKLGSAAIDNNQEASIHATAEYLKANPSAKVNIVGYADKGTGTASINMKLSEKRAKNVANQLINKYGISKDRVSTEWKGSTEQPYKENAWNRVAIFFAK